MRSSSSPGHADTEITAAKVTNRDVEATLAAALQAASNCQQAYLTAPEPIRKQINQGFFTKLFIGEDGTVERAELTEPFATLLDRGDTVTMEKAATSTEDAVTTSQITPDTSVLTQTTGSRTHPSNVFKALYGDLGTMTDGTETNTHRTLICTVRGLNEDYVVGTAGIEPATARV